MTTKLDPTVKKQWVKALRSGQYTKTTGTLRDENNHFCCLGVLCNLHAQAHPEHAATQKNPLKYFGEAYLPPAWVQEWANLDTEVEVMINDSFDTLYSHNDNGITFEQIADAIESQL